MFSANHLQTNTRYAKLITTSRKSSHQVRVPYFVVYLTEISGDPGWHYNEKYVDYSKQDRHMSRGTYRSRRLASNCVHTVDCVCQFTQHILEQQPVNIIGPIGRRNAFHLLSIEDDIRVTLGRREVKGGSEGAIIFHEIVNAETIDFPKFFEPLRHPFFQRVGAFAFRPNIEDIILNGRELLRAIETRDVEQMSNSTNGATGSTPLSCLTKI